jgi:RNA 2',3'-cyclic 3'-phosphodiesterase
MSEGSQRLFLALPLPAITIDFLKSLQDDLAQKVQVPTVRWLPEESWHITLHFLGETPTENIPALEKDLGEISFENCEQEMSAIVAFPSFRHANVLGIEGTEVVPSLEKLQKDLADVLKRNEIEPETRAFRPHITLARFKKAADLREIKHEFTPFFLPVSSFVLYKSDLHPDGVKYTRLKTFPPNAPL